MTEDEYRDLARKARETAAKCPDPEDAASWMGISEQWTKLADRLALRSKIPGAKKQTEPTA